MQNIHVKRYENPKATGWSGWIEPADKSWIAFIGLDGAPKVYLHRDPTTGAVLPDDLAEREARLAEIARFAARGLVSEATGAASDGEAVSPVPPWMNDRHEADADAAPTDAQMM